MSSFDISAKNQDEELEEIRRLQAERKQMEGKLASFSQISYDQEFYGSSKKDSDQYVTSIPVSEVELAEEEEEELKNMIEGKRRFLNSFTAPKFFIEETRETPDDFDPFKDKKKKTIADREDEYKARWRKRKLSPEHVDPFAKDGKSEKEQRSSYRDVMLDIELEKEKRELVNKIKQKQKEEAAEKRKDIDGPKKEKKGWIIEVTKNGQNIGEFHLDEDITYSMGRDNNNDILLEHPSCSKKHSKLTFISGRPNLMDLNSTNGTLLNEEELVPGQYYKLSDGDIIEFGCSTRKYRVKNYD